MTVMLIIVALILAGIGQWGRRRLLPAVAAELGDGDPAITARVAVLRRGTLACHVVAAVLLVTAVMPFL
ncbi:hypothetical protein HFP15_10040 [Amycolatopsis sp. K13G38]|uniref:Uncharacterized protein n=1 Tax=Amycolatopsis acididurans TaxID=2724524 RepID=A0ABX1J0C6_9PSEU|nr:hypothetical protein [Amycolatopsis acididurans]NKQ53222.1 hypothetical protein [Amycolatopsis acididurans]